MKKMCVCLLAAGLMVLGGGSPSAYAGEDGATINGDVNGDDLLNIADPVFLLNFLYGGGPAPVAVDCPADQSDRIAELEGQLAVANAVLADAEARAAACENLIPGCTDPAAPNFNPLATIDDGTCGENPVCEAGGCTQDRLKVIFDETGNSVLQLRRGQESFDVTVVLDTVSNNIQGWSYALAHDSGMFSIADTACEGRMGYLCGTDAQEALVSPFFNVSKRVGAAQDSPPGFISVVVLSFIAPAVLGVEQTNSLAKLTYNVDNTPTRYTRLRLAHDELRDNGPTVEVGITIAGEERSPYVGHGEIFSPR